MRRPGKINRTKSDKKQKRIIEERKRHVDYLKDFGIPHTSDTSGLGHVPVFSEKNRKRLVENLEKASKKHGSERVRQEVSRILRESPDSYRDPILERIGALAREKK
jgi:hypothetical protein